MQDSETVLLVPLDLATREAHSECIDDAQTMYLRVSPSGSFGAVSVCGHVVMCPTINHDEPGALGTFTEYNCFDWRTGRRLLVCTNLALLDAHGSHPHLLVYLFGVAGPH